MIGERLPDAPAPTDAPIAWGLLDTRTGKIEREVYMRQKAAVAGAARVSNRWRTVVAVPLYLHSRDVGA